MQKSGTPSRRVIAGGGIAAVIVAAGIAGAVWLGSNTAKTEISPVGSVAQVLPNNTLTAAAANSGNSSGGVVVSGGNAGVTVGEVRSGGNAGVTVGTVVSGGSAVTTGSAPVVSGSTSADANTPLSTSRVQLNSSLNLAKVKVPVYPGMNRKYIAPVALDSLIDRLISADSQKLLGFFNNKINFETFQQPGDCTKIKERYATDLGNAGWKNVSDLFTSSLSSGTSLESAGGFSSSYQKNEGFTAYITTITCMPAATATTSGVTGLAATDFLITFTLITQP